MKNHKLGPLLNTKKLLKFTAVLTMNTCMVAAGLAVTLPAFAEREMISDRPDRTEGPFTVEPGRYQLETDFLNFTQTTEDVPDESNKFVTEEKTNSLVINNMNLKAGITHDLDVQLMLETYNIEETESGGKKTKTQGMGDTTLRLKYNFFGNDGGTFAFGIIPFVKLPTADKDLDRNKKVEGGVILPWSTELPDDWGLGAMMQFNHVADAEGNAYHQEMVISASLSHDWTDHFGSYVEIYTEQSFEFKAELVSTGDLGMTYGLNKNCQIDVGLNIGLTKAADDLNAFTGIAYRF